jgi:hypothetical protein
MKGEGANPFRTRILTLRLAITNLVQKIRAKQFE